MSDSGDPKQDKQRELEAERAHYTTDTNQEQKCSEPQASQARCIDMPNDAEEGHYWSWVNSPQSIPSSYRHCMVCDRIDASEAISRLVTEARVEKLEALLDQHESFPWRKIQEEDYQARKFELTRAIEIEKAHLATLTQQGKNK